MKLDVLLVTCSLALLIKDFKLVYYSLVLLIKDLELVFLHRFAIYFKFPVKHAEDLLWEYLEDSAYIFNYLPEIPL